MATCKILIKSAKFKCLAKINSSRRVSRSKGGGLKTLCIKISEPIRAESREGSEIVTESVTG